MLIIFICESTLIKLIVVCVENTSNIHHFKKLFVALFLWSFNFALINMGCYYLQFIVMFLVV